jgi:quinone-modifying oxidoreductase subunit QmoB
MPGKLGVYICTGCGIGDALDTAQLAKLATGECKSPVCRTHAALCGAEGASLIAEDLASGTVDAIVIAACSPRFKADLFNFNHGSVTERVNLREHVAWCHKPQDEDTQMLAEDYLRMGIARALKTEPVTPLDEAIWRTVLVVGGGVTGITAALEAAEAGHTVILVEKADTLGGFGDRRNPDIEKVLHHPAIRVFASSHIVKIEGQPGMFDVTLATEPEAQTIRAGAIVVATGWKPYDASRLAHLGYGIQDVITNVEFAQMARGARWSARRRTWPPRACYSSSALDRAMRSTCPTALRPAAWRR